MSPTTEVYGTDPIGIDRRDESSDAWLFLFDMGMMAYPAGTMVSADGSTPRKPIGPTRTKDGRLIHVSACLRGGNIINGLLLIRSGARMILAADGGAFITFHTGDAVSVVVAYMDPPEDTAP